MPIPASGHMQAQHLGPSCTFGACSLNQQEHSAELTQVYKHQFALLNFDKH